MAYGGNRRPNSIQAIPHLRCGMISKFQREISNFPPNTAALKYNIPGCHYMTLVLRRSLSTLQNLLSPLLRLGRCKCRENALQCADIGKCVDCENDNIHDASDNELEYLIIRDKEYAQCKTLGFQTFCLIWFLLVYIDIMRKFLQLTVYHKNHLCSFL